jgi:abortive infection bacteriophage resistance protein
VDDEPFKTISEQIEILSKRGVDIDDKDSVSEQLEREGYYAIINGYKKPFLEVSGDSASHTEDKFFSGTKFDYIYGLFDFDRRLRMIVLHYLIVAETTLRTVCAYHFELKHKGERDAYTCPQSYQYPKTFKKLKKEYIVMDNFSRTLENRNKKDYIEHYKKCHQRVPLWVLFNAVSLGNVIAFFSILPQDLQSSICNSYKNLCSENYPQAQVSAFSKEHRFNVKGISQIDGKSIDCGLNSAYGRIKDVGNACAHDERLYCLRVGIPRESNLSIVIRDLKPLIRKSLYDEMVQDIEGLFDYTAETYHISAERMKSVTNELGFDRMSISTL